MSLKREQTRLQTSQHQRSPRRDPADNNDTNTEFITPLNIRANTLLPFQVGDVFRAIHRVKLGKTPGQDGLTAEVVRSLSAPTLTTIASVLIESAAQVIWENNIPSTTWTPVLAHALQKPGKLRLTNIRIIAN